MKSLEGKIASQGIAEGKAFVTSNPLDVPPFKRYILVTQNSDPEISPLLFCAEGIVTEIGGLMSHLAVVSREIKIPCITACEGCCEQIKTGQYIKINATKKLNSKVEVEYD